MSPDKEADLGTIRELYESSLAQHGTSPPGVGWRDPASHALRFSRLAMLIESKQKPYTINDLGCGYGAFHEYLRMNGFALRHFRGYDISDEMLTRARSMHPDGDYILGSVLNMTADYSFACGIFNVRLKETEENWRIHVERTLDNLDAFSIYGFAFNLLTSYVDYRESHLYYGDPLYFFDFCKRRFSRKVSLLHDYPLFEWTIHVVK